MVLPTGTAVEFYRVIMETAYDAGHPSLFYTAVHMPEGDPLAWNFTITDIENKDETSVVTLDSIAHAFDVLETSEARDDHDEVELFNTKGERIYVHPRTATKLICARKLAQIGTDLDTLLQIVDITDADMAWAIMEIGAWDAVIYA